MWLLARVGTFLFQLVSNENQKQASLRHTPLRQAHTVAFFTLLPTDPRYGVDRPRLEPSRFS